MIGGRATPEGTARRAGGRPGYRTLGATGLSVSILGFGGYRTGRTDPSHRAALRAALAAGVNLIDTSTNYLLGESERLVGEVLAEGHLPRDEVVVATKIGYLQGPNLEHVRQREFEGRPYPDVVKYADSIWHCIAPEFLEDQLTQSLERLGLETVDLLLLHNPEYFLSEATHRQPPPPLDETREIFYGRLRKAFNHLDGEVRAGRVGAYGVSSNSAVSPADALEATNVTRMVETSSGRLSALQLPYNLLETGALFERNTPDGTALQAAQRRGLGVLVNRPLNATGPQGGLIRLADPAGPGQPSSDEALLARVAALGQRETAFGRLFPGARAPRLAALLQAHWETIRSPRAWAQLFRGELLPDVRHGLQSLVASVDGQPTREQARAIEEYQEELNALLERLQGRAQRQDPRLTGAIRAAIEPHLPPELRSESLSRLALDFVASSPGVTTVLCGMRDPTYVEDAVALLSLPPIPDVTTVADALRQARAP